MFFSREYIASGRCNLPYFASLNPIGNICKLPIRMYSGGIVTSNVSCRKLAIYKKGIFSIFFHLQKKKSEGIMLYKLYHCVLYMELDLPFSP